MDRLLLARTRMWNFAQVGRPAWRADLIHSPPTYQQRYCSSASLVACPFPFNQADTPHVLVYQHVPYGKYEVRQKLPHLIYHTNNWSDVGKEYDLNESWNPGEIHPA